jgi:hypothetical protein
MQDLASELRRITLPRTSVNKGKKKDRDCLARPSASFSRILLRGPPPPLLGLERLAQRGVRLRWDNQVIVLV